MRHTIVIDLPDHLHAGDVEEVVTQTISELEIWDQQSADDPESSVNYQSPAVVEYHREQITTGDEAEPSLADKATDFVVRHLSLMELLEVVDETRARGDLRRHNIACAEVCNRFAELLREARD